MVVEEECEILDPDWLMPNLTMSRHQADTSLINIHYHITFTL